MIGKRQCIVQARICHQIKTVAPAKRCAVCQLMRSSGPQSPRIRPPRGFELIGTATTEYWQTREEQSTCPSRPSLTCVPMQVLRPQMVAGSCRLTVHSVAALSP